MPIEDLILDPANARTHDDTNLAAIEGSLRRFGQAEALVLQASTKRVVGGNGKLAVIRQLGWTECDVVEMIPATRSAPPSAPRRPPARTRPCW